MREMIGHVLKSTPEGYFAHEIDRGYESYSIWKCVGEIVGPNCDDSLLFLSNDHHYSLTYIRLIISQRCICLQRTYLFIQTLILSHFTLFYATVAH